jgi:hypothetical protein
MDRSPQAGGQCRAWTDLRCWVRGGWQIAEQQLFGAQAPILGDALDRAVQLGALELLDAHADGLRMTRRDCLQHTEYFGVLAQKTLLGEQLAYGRKSHRGIE